MQHLDATNRPITKGAYVAYVVTNGSTSGIKFGIVVKLKQKDVTETVYDAQTQTYNPVQKTYYSVSIVSADRNHRWDQASQTRIIEWVVQGKSNTDRPARVTSIERLDRIIVLDSNQVHPEAKEVIDKEMCERGSL